MNNYYIYFGPYLKCEKKQKFNKSSIIKKINNQLLLVIIEDFHYWIPNKLNEQFIRNYTSAEDIAFSLTNEYIEEDKNHFNENFITELEVIQQEYNTVELLYGFLQYSY